MHGITSASGADIIYRAQALYKSEDYAGAAWIFEQVVTGAMPGDTHSAQFWLGKSYFKLDDYERSAAVMMEIARSTGHSYQSLAIPWLLSLHEKLPDDRAIVQTIGEFGPACVDEEAFTEVRVSLLITIAEHHLRSRDPERALAILSGIRESEGDYGEVNLWAGRAAAQLGRTPEAVEHFRIATTWDVPTRKEQRKRKRRGQADTHRDRIVAEARAELDRLGYPPED